MYGKEYNTSVNESHPVICVLTKHKLLFADWPQRFSYLMKLHRITCDAIFSLMQQSVHVKLQFEQAMYLRICSPAFVPRTLIQFAYNCRGFSWSPFPDLSRPPRSVVPLCIYRTHFVLAGLRGGDFLQSRNFAQLGKVV